ncbi:hypothetical protein BKA69DRAFT_677467 [Paraphysoderma sedebokerense]|nr:hypothetical protein BKA69DRAFT_677467 [Paraphysoderma sedebokerense]
MIKVRYAVQLGLIAPLTPIFTLWQLNPDFRVGIIGFYVLFDVILNSLGILFCLIGAFSMFEVIVLRFLVSAHKSIRQSAFGRSKSNFFYSYLEPEKIFQVICYLVIHYDISLHSFLHYVDLPVNLRL